MQDTILSVSDFVALINQTLEYAYPEVIIEGEVSEYRVIRNKWIRFKLQDEESSVDFFGVVYQIRTPVEDGMMVKVRGKPRLNNKYGFSVSVQQITPSGEGSIRRAFELLKAQLTKEGLFDPERKRPLPEYPQTIGLISSSQAAAYSDFNEILNQQWSGVTVKFVDVLVQGDNAPDQIVKAIEKLNSLTGVEVIVLTRGGGSLEDLQAFNDESVVRAVANSRVPMVVGVGHETDVSLADLAADIRAATPTNAAQIVVPNRDEVVTQLNNLILRMAEGLAKPVKYLDELKLRLAVAVKNSISESEYTAASLKRLITAQNPKKLLERGYSIVRHNHQVVKDAAQVSKGNSLMIELGKGKLETEVTNAQSK